jgi:transcriptional regulator with XRE-family HTH domain
MFIGQRLRQLREQKSLSLGDIEKATGLLRHYTSGVELGHTVPSLETLERFAAGLKVPLYRLFYSGEGAPATPHLTPRLSFEELAEDAGPSRIGAPFLPGIKELGGKKR